MVASPPSSRMRFGPSAKSKILSAAHQYSSRVSPFHAKTGTPAGASGVPEPTTTAAAASSCVEKMLQLAHRTSAPSATRVSMSTAVCTVMCRLPAMRAPASGAVEAYSSRSAMRPGISLSARRIWCRPASARLRSATLKSVESSTVPPYGGLSDRLRVYCRAGGLSRRARSADSEGALRAGSSVTQRTAVRRER